MDSLLANSLKLLNIDSTQSKPTAGAPFGVGTKKALDFVFDLAKKLGFKTVNLDGYIGYAVVGEGEPFGILGHLDTVPIGEGWTKNPLGELDGDILYGRGTLDDKLPILSCLLATGELLKTKKPKRQIKIIFGLNEESGWGCIDHFNKVDSMPKEGFSPDADFPVINCEKGIVNYKISLPLIDGFEIKSGERANIVPNKCYVAFNGEKLSFDGIASHGAHPEGGDNAIIKALKTLSNKNEKIKFLYDKLYDYNGKGLDLDLSDTQSGHLTQNVGVAWVDDKLNFVLDIRYPVTYQEDEILKRLKNAFENAEIEKTHFHLPLYVESNNNLVKSLLNVYNDLMGENLKPISIGGGTYARALPLGVAFGPVFPSNPLPIHCPDEHIPLSDLYKMHEIYKAAINKLCF